jgi:hypothetical protein
MVIIKEVKKTPHKPSDDLQQERAGHTTGKPVRRQTKGKSITA